MSKFKQLDPLTEPCDQCIAEVGEPCVETHMDRSGKYIKEVAPHDTRWRRAHETRECLEEERLERQRDTMADYKCSRGGPV